MTERDDKLILEKQARAKKKAIESMTKVLAIPSGTPERWRAAYVHFLRQRPDAWQVAKAIAEYNEGLKLTMDKMGRTKSGHNRHVMSAPEFLMGVLQNTDPNYFIGADMKKLSSAEHLRKLKRAFPEFFLPGEV